jgi:hypothetical protein
MTRGLCAYRSNSRRSEDRRQAPKAAPPAAEAATQLHLENIRCRVGCASNNKCMFCGCLRTHVAPYTPSMRSPHVTYIAAGAAAPDACGSRQVSGQRHISGSCCSCQQAQPPSHHVPLAAQRLLCTCIKQGPALPASSHRPASESRAAVTSMSDTLRQCCQPAGKPAARSSHGLAQPHQSPASISSQQQNQYQPGAIYCQWAWHSRLTDWSAPWLKQSCSCFLWVFIGDLCLCCPAGPAEPVQHLQGHGCPPLPTGRPA